MTPTADANEREDFRKIIMPRSIETQINHHAAVDSAAAAGLAELSMRDRGELLLAACRSAAQIYHSRLASGLPIECPSPWPTSTWEFLKAQANHVRQASNS